MGTQAPRQNFGIRQDQLRKKLAAEAIFDQELKFGPEIVMDPGLEGGGTL